MVVSVFQNFITLDELSILNEYYSTKPYANEKYKDTVDGYRLAYKNKNTDYDLTDSTVYKILNPKITEKIGSHKLSGGQFLESHYPYGPHVDTIKQFEKKEFYNHETQTTNKGLIIPLEEHPSFNTIFFDLFSDENITPVVNLEDKKYDHPFDLSHFSKEMFDYTATLKITDAYNWKLGTAVLFDRNQLHCATNFTKHRLTKTAIVLFL
jgi:hypothetical protein